MYVVTMSTVRLERKSITTWTGIPSVRRPVVVYIPFDYPSRLYRCDHVRNGDTILESFVNA